jgi:hypothetical protein
MNIRELASAIAKRESGKSNVKIGDIREIIAILADYIVEDPDLLVVMLEHGIKRLKKQKGAH